MIPYDAVWSRLPQITGLPLELRGKQYFGACYLTGESHSRRDKLVCSRSSDGGITILEQGNSAMQLWVYLRTYHNLSDKEVAAKLKGLTASTLNVPPPRVEPPARYVRKQELETSMSMLGKVEDNLFKWLCQHFEREVVINAFKRYNISNYTLNDGRRASRFWFVDFDGNVVHDKLMLYGLNGRRDKTYGGGRIFRTADGYSHRCYFGENLVNDTDLFYLVESEKTALLVYLTTGRFCLATGGANNLKRIKKNYRLLPDYDEAGFMWLQKFPQLCIKWWESEIGVQKGNDIGDIIWRKLENKEN